MVKIRLSRFGKKNFATFRIVVTEKAVRRDGRHLEHIGWYNPKEKDPAKKIKVKVDRIQEWVSKGAQISPAVLRLLKHCGIEIGKTAAAS